MPFKWRLPVSLSDGVCSYDIGYIAYSIEQVYVTFTSIKEVNKLYTSLFRVNENLIENFRKISNGIVSSRLTPLAALGCIASIVSLILATESLYYDAKHHRYGYMLADGLMIGSSVLTLLSTRLLYVEAETVAEATTIELVAELLGIAGAALTLGALLLMAYLNQPDVLKWSTDNPYSLAKPNNDSEDVTTQKLTTVLAKPQVKIKSLSYAGEPDPSKKTVMIEVLLPYFEMGKMQLVVQSTWEKRYLTSQGDVGVSGQIVMPVTKIEQRMQDGKIAGMRYYYMNIDVGDLREIRSFGDINTPFIKYRTRVRLQTADGKTSIPYVDSSVSMSINAEGISDDDGWVYVEL